MYSTASTSNVAAGGLHSPIPGPLSGPCRPQRTRRTQPLNCDQAGQTTAEYALLTGAIALLVAAVTAWATSTGKVGQLLDAVFNYLTRVIS